VEEREGFFRSLFKGLTETAGAIGPGLAVAPNEIERAPELMPAENEGQEPSKTAETAKTA